MITPPPWGVYDSDGPRGGSGGHGGGPGGSRCGSGGPGRLENLISSTPGAPLWGNDSVGLIKASLRP